MTRLGFVITLLVTHCSLMIAQDTTCSIVWYPGIQLWDRRAASPKIALSGDDTVHVIWFGDNNQLRLPYGRSVDGGSTFEPVREILTDSANFPVRPADRMILANGNVVYAFFTMRQPPSVMWRLYVSQSTDRGDTWIYPSLVSSTDSIALIGSATNSHDTLALIHNRDGQPWLLRVSPDGGLSWHLRDNLYYDMYSRVALSPATLHLARTIGINFLPAIQYKRSFDLGETWADSVLLSSATGNASDLPAIAADSTRVVTIWRDDKYGCQGLVECSVLGRLSINNGITFLPETALTEQPNGAGAHAALNGSTIAAAWFAKVGPTIRIHARVSRDAGQTWCPTYDLTPTAYACTSPRVVVSRSAVHIVWTQTDTIGGNFYVFYRRGVFLPTSVHEQPPLVPMEVQLFQNYPNPFNPKTVISFQLSVSGFVALKVYDILGREVAVLMSEPKQPGTYEVEWNAEILPSGMYYYRLFAGGRVETKKAMLVK